MKTIRFCGHKNIIHTRLIQAREAHLLSQQQLAAKLQLLEVSIDQQAISKIELDKRIVTDYELMCLCKVLHVKAAWLMGDLD
ncbi:MAG: helix-turn-helix transcriptional regulator [Angelakisella sp.]